MKNFPNDSIKVLFPTPGTPVIPNRQEFPAYGRHIEINWSASLLCFGFLLSNKVMAEEMAVRSP
jgi:hypothetical protein